MMPTQRGVATEVTGGETRQVPAARTELPGNALAASAGRTFVRAALAEWGLGGAVADDAVLLVSELVTNAVVHAGTAVGLECRQEGGSFVGEVSDRHPTRAVETRGGDLPDDAPGGVPDTARTEGKGERAGVRTGADGGNGTGSDGNGTGSGGGNGGGGAGRAAASTDDGTDVSVYGHGLRLVAALAEEWGVTYRRDRKTVWFKLAVTGQGPRADDMGNGRAVLDRYGNWSGLSLTGMLAPSTAASAGSEAATGAATVTGAEPVLVSHSALSFLAEASDFLAGQTDEDKVASLSGQLLVPRFADWCAVWLEGADAMAPPRLARVWHSQENRIEELRTELEKNPPGTSRQVLPGQAVPWPWPGEASAYGPGGAAVACRLIVGGRAVGTLAIGRAGLLRISEEVIGIVEDFSRRVALAVLAARRYTRQATISKVLQRGLLPSGEVVIPGIETAVVYEPAGEGSWAGGDFYDFFEVEEGRWRFALGDVCGNGPEAAVVTGLARPVLRLLAREGYGVPDVLDRLNREVGEQARFLSLIYGELRSLGPESGGGVECTVVCAGHPLPLVREVSGEVHAAALPQLLLGVVDEVSYDSQTFMLLPGETLLCVTDGVTERRSGQRQFDDEGGLASTLSKYGARDAATTAELLRRAVHGFAADAPTDDLALMVLRVR
ncbi:SpoIIE family protein phosphatase [Streptomyces daliensis]